MAACLDDAREPGKVLHGRSVAPAAIFGCAGYADCNDAARLVRDPIHKLVVGRDPLTGLGLASQPTLSRFENAVSARELRAMTHVLADTVIAQQQRRLHGRATRITIDLDPTDDPTHGQQEFAFFNGHYDTWCYLPVVATVTFNDEPAQLRRRGAAPGQAPAGLGARGILRALLRKLRRAFPGATFRVRLDGGLPPQAVSFSRARTGRVRRRHGEQSPLGQARAAADGPGAGALAPDGETHICTARRGTRPRSGRTSAGHHQGRVVRHPSRTPKNNPRFVVTNLTDQPQAVYEFYCARSDIENRIKELHQG